MKRIPLYEGVCLIGWTTVDDDDYEDLVQWLWRRMRPAYAVRYEEQTGRTIYMHRYLMGLARGDGLEVDHVNGDPSDNRRSNLRVATRAQQLCNTRTRSALGRGVKKTPAGRYAAQGKVNGRMHYLGTYDTAEAAAAAAAEWRREHHGEFATTR